MDWKRQLSKSRKTRKRFFGKPSAAEVCGVPLPAIVIRMVRVAQEADQTGIDAPPMLYPHRPSKNWMGRDQLSRISQALVDLLAVYSVVALRLLQAADRSLIDATIVIEGAAAQSLKRLRKVAQKRLSSLTGFDDDLELIAWASNPTSLFRIPVFVNGTRPATLQEASIDVVELLQTTFARARSVSNAIHATQLSPDIEVGAALTKAFAAGARFSSWDCYRVALFADINPAPLWRAHAHCASVFELGRFVGRVDRGAKALLPSYHQEAMDQALAGLPIGKEAELATMHDNIRSAIEVHFGVARFQKLLEEARRTGGVIAVDRQSRRLRCRTDMGLSARVRGRS